MIAGLFHLVYFFALFFLFPRTPLWIMLVLGFIYALMINANINGVGHNFIHNPFFRSSLLNRLFGIVESVACCFSQTYYDVVHMQHHKGNADRPDENGETVDWISIYRHDHDGEAENPWSYVFLSFFRDNPAAGWPRVAQTREPRTYVGKHRPGGFCELSERLFPALWDGNPDKPVAWSVSSYGKLYNWLFFYNGYHAENHFRPKVHWTKMEAFHQKIADLQRQEGVRVINHAHMLGFLDPDLPPRKQVGQAPSDFVKSWVGWDSNPEPTPKLPLAKAFGVGGRSAASYLAYLKRVDC